MAPFLPQKGTAMPIMKTPATGPATMLEMEMAAWISPPILDAMKARHIIMIPKAIAGNKKSLKIFIFTVDFIFFNCMVTKQLIGTSADSKFQIEGVIRN